MSFKANYILLTMCLMTFIVNAQDTICSKLIDETQYSYVHASNSSFFDSLSTGDNMVLIINIGDLNNDGYDDIVTSVPGYQNQGIVFVCFLDSLNTIIDYKRIGEGFEGFPYTLSESAAFGYSGDLYGDYNNDGVQDILLTAYRSAEDGHGAGSFFIICLNTDGTIKESFKIAYGTENIPHEVLSQNRFFGSSIEPIGDINNDGIIDLAVGSVNYDTDETSNYVGAFSILLLGDSGQVKSTTVIDEISQDFSSSDRFGQDIVYLGDINKDDLIEIVVTSRQGDDICYNCGTMYMCSIDSTGNVVSYHRITSLDDVVSSNTRNAYLSSLSDLNGDGINELAVGSLLNDELSIDGGQIYVLYLNSEGEADSVTTVFRDFRPNEGANLRSMAYDVNGKILVSGHGLEVEGKASGGIISFDGCMVNETSSVNESLVNNFVAYPTVVSADGIITIEGEGINKIRMNVFNIFGQKIPFKKEQISNDRIRIKLKLSSIGSNMLFLNFSNGKTMSTKKLIIAQ